MQVLVAQMIKKKKKLPAMQETQVQSLDWEDSLEKGMATHSSILPWRFLREIGVQWLGLQRVRPEDVTE